MELSYNMKLLFRDLFTQCKNMHECLWGSKSKIHYRIDRNYLDIVDHIDVTSKCPKGGKIVQIVSRLVSGSVIASNELWSGEWTVGQYLQSKEQQNILSIIKNINCIQ